jgi:L,D-transpeptidase ErfK/SrfK
MSGVGVLFNGGGMARTLTALIAACWVWAAGQQGASAWEEEDFFQKAGVKYTVAESDSVFGELRAYRVKRGDTLFDIARQYSVGYNELVESNPGLDVWLPPPGAIVLLPKSWILPCCGRRGLVINIPEMRLYYFTSSAEGPGVTDVITYPVGLGREEWQTPRGKFKVLSKTANPTWVIPESIRDERIAEDGDMRTSIPGGAPDNPLGGYRLALSLPSYAIHGTNIPWGVGMQVSHGCIRLYPEDVERLFGAVPVGTPGEFVYQPVKIGVRAGDVYVEVTRDIYGLTPALWKEARAMFERLGVAERVDQELLMAALQHPTGTPVKISGSPDSGKVAAVDKGTDETGMIEQEVRSDARIPYTNDLEAGDD